MYGVDLEYEHARQAQIEPGELRLFRLARPLRSLWTQANGYVSDKYVPELWVVIRRIYPGSVTELPAVEVILTDINNNVVIDGTPYLFMMRDIETII